MGIRVGDEDQNGLRTQPCTRASKSRIIVCHHRMSIVHGSWASSIKHANRYWLMISCGRAENRDVPCSVSEVALSCEPATKRDRTFETPVPCLDRHLEFANKPANKPALSKAMLMVPHCRRLYLSRCWFWGNAENRMFGVIGANKLDTFMRMPSTYQRKRTSSRSFSVLGS